MGYECLGEGEWDYGRGYCLYLPCYALFEGEDHFTNLCQQLFLSDPETKFSKSLGWTMGERTARYAMIIDHGKVVYAEKEPGRDVTVRMKVGFCWEYIADA